MRNNNSKRIILDSKIYNLETVLTTCYSFIDWAYIFLDTDSNGKRIIVSLKGKQKLYPKRLEQLEGEFKNELLHSALRYKISKNNKKIKEYIIGRALYSALPAQEDPLDIATAWKEKYGKKKNAKPKL